MNRNYGNPEAMYAAEERTCLCEVWKPIPGWPRYEVSDQGRIRRLLKLQRNNGYPSIILSINRIWKSFRLHTLVAMAFLGPRPDDHVVNHKDADRDNNWLRNLEYVTQKENLIHAEKLGLITYRWGIPKLSEEKVLAIRAAHDGSKKSLTVLANQFGVSEMAVKNIVRRKTWRTI